MSRGSVNITTWPDFGSIETVIRVSVLWPPPCSSAPMSRMLSRSLPSHGGTTGPVTAGPRDGSGVATVSGGSVSESVGPGDSVGLQRFESASKMQLAVSDRSAS